MNANIAEMLPDESQESESHFGLAIKLTHLDLLR